MGEGELKEGAGSLIRLVIVEVGSWRNPDREYRGRIGVDAGSGREMGGGC